MNYKKSIFILLFFLSCLFNVYLVNQLDKKVKTVIEKPEIIFLDSIEYDTVYLEKKEIVKLPIYNTDTILTTDTIVAVAVDSVFVEIPIEYKHFSDTLAESAISFDLRGYNCKVNNLYVKNFLNVPTQENKPKRWGLGVQLGTGITKEKISPYIGVGISYNLFSF